MVPSPRVVVVDSLLTTASSTTLFGSELMASWTVWAESVWRRVLVVNSSLSVERNVRANSTLLQKYAPSLGMMVISLSRPTASAVGISTE